MSFQIGKVLKTLKDYYGEHEFNRKNKRNPFRTLVSCILSLRTKDEVTNAASDRLFSIIKGAKDLENLDTNKLSKTIYPVGFYKTKAQNLKGIAKKLNEEYKGIVPDKIDELIKFKGVGRKTANLVVSVGYGKLGICVDTHVHQISNRFGYIKTKTPLETEMALRKKLSKNYWHDINHVLVHHGQHICKPIGPKCSVCPVERWCGKVFLK